MMAALVETGRGIFLRLRQMRARVEEVSMAHGSLFGLGLAAALVLVWWGVFVNGIGRTAAGFFKIAFWAITAAAAMLALFWPPAVVGLVIAGLVWIFFLNPHERDS